MEAQHVVEKLNKLSKIDFSNVDRRMKKNFPSADIIKVKNEFFHFFVLCETGAFIIPPKMIDEYWHEFIIHQKFYQDVCQKVFGKFIYHTPNDGKKYTDSERFEIYKKTVFLYDDFFGEPDAAIWGLQKI